MEEKEGKNIEVKSKKKRSILLGLGFLILLMLSFYFFCGIFVIQPIGAVPEGATIIYWRSGLNLPFLSSADGILLDSGSGVSLLGRGVILAKVSEPIRERELFRLGYSKTLYLWTTDGKEFSR